MTARGKGVEVRHRDWFEGHVSGIADAWQSCANRLACSGIYPRSWELLVWPTDGTEYGSLALLPDTDPGPREGWQYLATLNASCYQNRACVRAWVREHGGRAPLLPLLGRW